ncbi:WXG100 family type VII secretion target [Nocardia sp. NBC_00416]|uniref:WXG100 family type VII secretion target n=1 Tax=Nocardia sp. NBC_00416 TaxID=2975991 RepID=UPI002E1A32DE
MINFSQWLQPILDGPNQASKNKSDDTTRAENENTTRNQDRAAVDGEWSGLVSEFGGQFAAPSILEKDGFSAMTHQQIWDALKDVRSSAISDKSTAWRNLAKEARAANDAFLMAVTTDLDKGWDGQSGIAAVNGVREFHTSFTSLAAGFQMLADGLGLMEGHLAQAKASVGEPDNVTIGDKIINILPLDDTLKTPQYRADEAQETARWVMTTYYEPGAADVDSRTPVLPEPKKTVDDGTDPGQPVQPVRTQPPPGETTQPQGTDTGDGTNTGDGAEPEDQGQPSESEDPQSTDPQSTTPQSTTPETPTNPSLTTGTPTTTTPGTPSGTPSGMPSGAPQTTGPFVPGQTVQGAPKTASTGSPAVAASTSNRAGRSGMPGMMSPGARGNKGDDDDEHKTPDYLVYDRGSELLGTQPPALPPGGVIGG